MLAVCFSVSEMLGKEIAAAVALCILGLTNDLPLTKFEI